MYLTFPIHILIACTMKLLGNSIFIGSIELMGEVMTLAEKSGIGAEHVRLKGMLPPLILIIWVRLNI